MSFGQIFTLSLGAILIENVVLVQFLGICAFLGVSKNSSSAIGMGLAVIFVMTISTAATYLVNNFVLIPLGLEYMQTVAFILVIAGLVQLVEMFLAKTMPSLYQALGIYLPLITTNCAVLGIALKAAENSYGFFQSVLYAAMSGVGFMLAIVLFSSVRERLELSECPKCFEGFPIALVTAALMALAFMGFQGMVI